MAQLVATSPTDGREIGRYEVAGPESVAVAVARARMAAEQWATVPVRTRCRVLRRLRQVMADDVDGIVQNVAAATGKPDLEALGGDLLVCLEMIRYYERTAPRLLEPQRRGAPLLFLGKRFEVHHPPLGVVAVIAPWNYPLQLALVPAVTALAAGNAVVLKPSELTPSVGELIDRLCRRAQLPPGLLQVLYGGGEVGRRLIEAGPDKVFFTGSVQTGREVMRAAADKVTPVELELGGKDAMIVFADANLQRTVNGAVYGAFANAGQSCVSVERAYVQRPIYEEFVEAVTRKVAALRLGGGREAEVGPLIRPMQRETVQAHIDDALARGGRLTTERGCESRLCRPAVLRDVSHQMRIMREETFGPVLPIMPFDTEEEVIRLANDSTYGLGAGIWTRDLERARRVAARLVVGNCAINDVIINIANPHVPFGGEKQSGLGRYHGPEGLLAFCRTKSIMVDRGRCGRQLNWFPFTRAKCALMEDLVRLLHGAGGPTRRLLRFVRSLARRKEAT